MSKEYDVLEKAFQNGLHRIFFFNKIERTPLKPFKFHYSHFFLTFRATKVT